VCQDAALQEGIELVFDELRQASTSGRPSLSEEGLGVLLTGTGCQGFDDHGCAWVTALFIAASVVLLNQWNYFSSAESHKHLRHFGGGDAKGKGD